MMTLAIEVSARPCSIALLNDGAPIHETRWDQDRSRNQVLFEHLDDLLSHGRVTADDIDRFAVGLGPGSFSSLRIALSTAQALALPGRKPVLGVASAEALAWEAVRRDPLPSIAVIGDARRGRLWATQYKKTDMDWCQAKDFTLTDMDGLPAFVEGTAAVVTPHEDRIGKALKENLPESTMFLEANDSPSAASVGLLAIEKSGETTSPLRPIYLHPPTTVKPKFPAAHAE